jgi:hypothetical protein
VERNNYTIKCTGGKAEEREGGVEGVDSQDCFPLVSVQKFNHGTVCNLTLTFAAEKVACSDELG